MRRKPILHQRIAPQAGTLTVAIAFFCAALLIVVALPLTARADEAEISGTGSKLPDTHAAGVLRKMIDALNSQNLDTLKAFARDHYAHFWFDMGQTPETLAAGLLERSKTAGGGYEIVNYVSKGDLLIGAKVRSAGGAYFSFSINTTEEAPQRIGMLMIAPTDSSTERGPAADDQELARRIDGFVTELVEHDQFSGSVLIAKAGKPIYAKAFGMASKTFDVPNTLKTRFRLGSMNKMFTAIAVAQLAEQGKLSFDDPVGKFLPNYPNSDVREKVTLHHLLTHTSGIADGMFRETRMRASPLLYLSIDDVLDLFADGPLQFEPGSKMEYCNSGFHLLGKIVEVASGMDYFDYVRKHIYAPAGMSDTDTRGADEVVPNLAVGYTRNRLGDLRYYGVSDAETDNTEPSDTGNAWYANTFVTPMIGGPAGGGYSTVEDMNKFAQALFGGKLLKPETVKKLTTGQVDMAGVPDGTARYGYGYMDATSHSGHRFVGHGGTFWGVSAAFRHYVGMGYTVVVLCNYESAAPTVAGKIDTLLPVMHIP